MSDMKLRGISAAARATGCAEDTLRDLHARGIVAPIRDSAGRRLFSEADIAAVRVYLAAKAKRAARKADVKHAPKSDLHAAADGRRRRLIR